MNKSILVVTSEKKVLYTMPGDVFLVVKDIYIRFNMQLRIKTDFETIYNQLPDTLKKKIKRIEGGKADFKKIGLEIREYPQDPLDGLN